MKTKLFCLLMLISATTFAQNTTSSEQDWEGASKQVADEHFSATQNGFEDSAALELSHPWHYGRQDSDTLVNRAREDEHHD